MIILELAAAAAACYGVYRLVPRKPKRLELRAVVRGPDRNYVYVSTKSMTFVISLPESERWIRTTIYRSGTQFLWLAVNPSGKVYANWTGPRKVFKRVRDQCPVDELLAVCQEHLGMEIPIIGDVQ